MMTFTCMKKYAMYVKIELDIKHKIVDFRILIVTKILIIFDGQYLYQVYLHTYKKYLVHTVTSRLISYCLICCSVILQFIVILSLPFLVIQDF